MSRTLKAVLPTDFGCLEIYGEDKVSEIRFSNKKLKAVLPTERGLKSAYQELAEYFKGTRKKFTFPYEIYGTKFQQKVWKALSQLSFGEMTTYGDLAKRIGSPRAARAVGGALNKNPLPLRLPCHRVVGSSGKLVGFAGGLPLKKKLIELERSC